MKTWMKWIGYAAGSLLLLLVVGYVSLDWIAGSAIEKSGSYATGVDARTEGVQLRPFGGTFGMDEFSLANPDQPAFDSEGFMRLKRTRVVFGLPQMFQSKVEIPEVTLQGLDINVERKEGSQNFQVILDHLKSMAREKESTGGQTYVVRKLHIRDIQVSFHGYPGVSQDTLQLADIQMSDVGTGENGLNRSELVGIIIREAFRQLLRNPELLPGAALEGLRTGMKGLGELGEVSVRFLGKITTESGTVIKDVGEGAASVGEAVGDLFGGGEDGETGEEEGKED